MASDEDSMGICLVWSEPSSPRSPVMETYAAWSDPSSPRSPVRAFYSEDEPSSPMSPKVANPELYAQCASAIRAITAADPEDYKNMNIRFDSERVGLSTIGMACGRPQIALETDGNKTRDNKRPPVLAFICSEGVLIAVDNSVAGTKRDPSVQNNIINFSSHVIGCVIGEAADCENVCKLLRSLKYPKKKRHSAKKIAMYVAKELSSDNIKGLCEIVFAGWDKTGPSLYRLDGDGNLYEGVLFHCGSCPIFATFVVVNRGFPSMSLDKAAKVVKIAITMALAESNSKSGDIVSDDAGEKNEVGGSVDVYYIGRDGSGHIPGGIKIETCLAWSEPSSPRSPVMETCVAWPEPSSPRSPVRGLYSQDERSPPMSPKVANPELYDQCASALRAITYTDPEDSKNMNICFDFDRVFHMYLVYQQLEWLVDGPKSPSRQMEIRPDRTNGPPVLAFICSEGVLIAVDNSVAGTKCDPSVENNIINFSTHVIGCVIGEAADCENVCKLLRSLKYPKKKRHSAKKIAKYVAKELSSDNMEGLCEIVFAGWDKTGPPSLYRLAGDGNLYEGGYCFTVDLVQYLLLLFLSTGILPVCHAIKLQKL